MKKILLAATALLIATSALAQGDVAAGKAKSVMCVACHGADGMATNPQYPNLAGQNIPYLVASLKAYKNQQRKGGQAPVMYGMVAGLTDADIDNLAAYYNSLK